MAKKAFGARAGESRGPRYTTATRTFQTAEDIMPIAELKATLSETIRELEHRPRPLVITLNGKPAAVVMSPREYDRLSYRQRIIDAVTQGLADARAGRVFDAEDVFDELERRYSEPARRKRS